MAKKTWADQLGRETGKNSLEIGKEGAYAPRGLEFEQPACSAQAQQQERHQIPQLLPKRLLLVAARRSGLVVRVCVAKVK
jgi:hypothetical protein